MVLNCSLCRHSCQLSFLVPAGPLLAAPVMTDEVPPPPLQLSGKDDGGSSVHLPRNLSERKYCGSRGHYIQLGFGATQTALSTKGQAPRPLCLSLPCAVCEARELLQPVDTGLASVVRRFLRVQTPSLSVLAAGLTLCTEDGLPLAAFFLTLIHQGTKPNRFETDCFICLACPWEWSLG